MYLQRSEIEHPQERGNYDHMAWCHGAAGIILSRTSCLGDARFIAEKYDFSLEEKYVIPTEAVEYLKRFCKEDNFGNDSLCCGLGVCLEAISALQADSNGEISNAILARNGSAWGSYFNGQLRSFSGCSRPGLCHA